MAGLPYNLFEQSELTSFFRHREARGAPVHTIQWMGMAICLFSISWKFFGLWSRQAKLKIKGPLMPESLHGQGQALSLHSCQSRSCRRFILHGV